MKTKILIIITAVILLGLSISVQARTIKKIAKTKVKIVNQSIGEPQLKDSAVGTLRVIGDDLITGSKIRNETLKNEDIAPDAAIDASKVNLSGYALSDLHQQNTDTGTNSNSFTVGSTGSDLSLFFGSSNRALTYLASSDKFSLSKSLSLGSNKITDLAAPTQDGDAATKAYVDNQLSTEIGNLKWKDPVTNFAALPTCNSSSDGQARLVLGENWIYRCDHGDDTWHKVANVATVNHNDLQNRDAAGAHPASAVTFSATGQISSTTVQAALAEVDSEKIPLTQSFSGDVAGTYNALAIGSGKVTNTMLSGSIADSKLNQLTTGNKVAGSAVQLATNPGLEDSTGLKIKLDGGTLTLSASGLKVTDNTYLPLAGGTMTGDIALGTHNLTATTGDVTADNITGNTLTFSDSSTQTTAANNTTYRHGDGRVGDYFCQKKAVSDSGQVGDWTDINNSQVCGFNKRCDDSGNCVESDFACGTSQVLDADSNVYNTVLIDDQCWLAKNLNVGVKLASGATMPANNGITEKWCYNNDDANCTTYGGLYHWDEAMQYSTTPGAQGICPASWHIPTDAEQYTLENYLKDGGQTCDAGRSGTWDCATAGSKLKEAGTTHWDASGGTNTSGFTALGAGFRGTDGAFIYLTTDASFWSSSPSGGSAWGRGLGSGFTAVYRGLYSKAYGFSVRCLKN